MPVFECGEVKVEIHPEKIRIDYSSAVGDYSVLITLNKYKLTISAL